MCFCVEYRYIYIIYQFRLQSLLNPYPRGPKKPTNKQAKQKQQRRFDLINPFCGHTPAVAAARVYDDTISFVGPVYFILTPQPCEPDEAVAVPEV